MTLGAMLGLRSTPVFGAFLIAVSSLAPCAFAQPGAVPYKAALVADINPGPGSSVYEGFDDSVFPNFTTYDGRLFFEADDGDGRGDLWFHDAATGKTVPAEILPERSSPVIVYDGRLFLTQPTGQGPLNSELWYYDAATDEAAGLGIYYWGAPVVYNGRLFVTADRIPNYLGVDLWADDAASSDVSYDTSRLAPGLYIARLAASGEAATRHSEGRHDVALEASHLVPGLYVFRLTAGDEVATRRLTVIR